MKDMDLYLALERLMMEMDENQNSVAEEIRDLLDPIWLRLSSEDLARLDARGHVDPRALFPVQLPVPARPEAPAATVENQMFERVGWQAPAHWQGKAA